MPSNRRYNVICPVCASAFTAKRRDARFCSHTCAVRASRTRSTDDEKVTARQCEFCHKSIEHKRRDARFCDVKCSRNAWYYTTGRSLKPRDGRTCVGCGDEIGSLRHPNATFCSLKCREACRRVAAHGLTMIEYRRRLADQSGTCAICGCVEDVAWMRDDLYRDGWHIDHDHVSGKVRGILCPPCNLMLGYAKDDPDVLSSAVSYLERTR